MSQEINEAKKITVITYGNKEHTYTDKDIQEFIKDPNISADNLPGWMYGAGLRGANGFPKKPKQVVDHLEKILKHKGNVTINVASDKPGYQNSIVFESEEINEGKTQIKRKYGEHGAINVYERGPIRNRIIEFVKNKFVTEVELKDFVKSLIEERGVEFNSNQWFARNKKYFESFENRGQQVWTLSKYGKRVYEYIVKKGSQKQINESVGLFKFESDINEGVRRNADQVNQDAERRIKDQIAKYSELMKTNPEKANIYKAQIDLAHARMTVVAMKKKLDQLKK
jgi:hypothetical protein